MASSEKQALRTLIMLICIMMACETSEACESPTRLYKVNLNSFYDTDTYGVLALADRRKDRAWIINQAGCFDGTRFRKKSRINIYFNNKIEESESSDVNYVGFTVLRTYNTKSPGEKSQIASVFRNGNKPKVSARWAHSSDALGIKRGAEISTTALRIVEKFDPEVVRSFETIQEINTLPIELASSTNSEWPALIVSTKNTKAKINENARLSVNRFKFPLNKINVPNNGKISARYYLIKYEDSNQPTYREVFANINPRGASCIFINYFTSKTNDPVLPIGDVDYSFIVLKMKNDAVCIK